MPVVEAINSALPYKPMHPLILPFNEAGHVFATKIAGSPSNSVDLFSHTLVDESRNKSFDRITTTNLRIAN
jgi:hypothetical protein